MDDIKAKVPYSFRKAFSKAQSVVEGFFETIKHEPDKGTITIGGERYILVRAASMSVHFFDFIRSMYPGLEPEDAIEAASTILFDIAHAIGKADAKSFHKKLRVREPVAKLSSGPIHFAYTGWAFVNIFPESRLSTDENCHLSYDHPYSFEADSWIAAGKKTKSPVCFMNAGYSSGWCEESFGVPLTSREIYCRAKGDPYCRFIMAHPAHVDERIEIYKKKYPHLFTIKKGKRSAGKKKAR